MKKLPVGISDFKDVITGGYYYVDKTLFIKEIIDSGDKILLLPRPRRFGKTLNLSMLAYFYDCCTVPWGPDSSSSSKPAGTRNSDSYKPLFDSLAIKNAGSEYIDKMGKHPVIFLSFRVIKDTDWDSCKLKLKNLIQDEYARHYYLLDSQVLLPHEREYFKKIINLEGDDVSYENSLGKLLFFLSRFYNKRAVILIDEYDTPIHAGFNNNYIDEVLNFMRNFLGGGLKDTDKYLEKGVLTGIMRVAKESIFSGLNNLGIYTLLSKKFNEHFGFTEEEVKVMLRDFHAVEMLGAVQSWYNGYVFGDKVIYNPWSIINYLNNEEKQFAPYWINTSDNKIVDLLLSKGGIELKKELEQLIRGESIEKAIDENIILKEVPIREDLLWSFLLMGGYLKQTSRRLDDLSGKVYYSLSIPNKEVRASYAGIIDRYFSTKIENEKLEIMLKALIDGDIMLFEQLLQDVVTAVFSFHDFSNEPEKVYHAFVAGLLIWISNTHEIKSNRESGYGRYDISIIPKDLDSPGYVIEFKSVNKRRNETVDIATRDAFKQIEEKKYETELVQRGVKHIKKLAIVFSGKEVFVFQPSQKN